MKSVSSQGEQNHPTPRGLLRSISPSRRERRLPRVSRSMIRLPSSHTDTLVLTTRSLRAYHRPLSKRSRWVVLLLLADSPSMLDKPTTLPPQPPTMSDR